MLIASASAAGILLTAAPPPSTASFSEFMVCFRELAAAVNHAYPEMSAKAKAAWIWEKCRPKQ